MNDFEKALELLEQVANGTAPYLLNIYENDKLVSSEPYVSKEERDTTYAMMVITSAQAQVPIENTDTGFQFESLKVADCTVRIELVDNVS